MKLGASFQNTGHIRCLSESLVSLLEVFFMWSKNKHGKGRSLLFDVAIVLQRTRLCWGRAQTQSIEAIRGIWDRAQTVMIPDTVRQGTHLIFDLSAFSEARHEIYTRSLHICTIYTLNLNTLFQIEIKQQINTFCLKIENKMKRQYWSLLSMPSSVEAPCDTLNAGRSLQPKMVTILQ